MLDWNKSTIDFEKSVLDEIRVELLSIEYWQIRVTIIFPKDLLKLLRSKIDLYDSRHFGGLGFGIMIVAGKKLVEVVCESGE